MSGVLELLPHDMGLRVELDTNETYYLKSGWIGPQGCSRLALKTLEGHETSRAIRYVECAHCGETVCTYYVTCPYCGHRLAVHSPPPREEMCGLTQITTD